MVKQNSLLTILIRSIQLITWLGKLMFRLRTLEGATVAHRQQVLQQMGRSLLEVLRVRIEHEPVPVHSNGALVVSNHISWLDIFVLNALYPSCFIAAKELRRWPVIGKMIANAGTVFIDRTNRKDIDPINMAIAERLQAHENVCFFPEAKTSLGNNVLPMKAALFQSAINAQADIQVIALRYYVENQRTELVSFSGTQFFITLWRILSLSEIVVRADFAPNLSASVQPDADRFALKDQVEQFIKQIVLSDSPHPDRVLLTEDECSR